jgi:short-subunit dehydrogenase
MNLSNATVLLTGATGGIGRAIAEQLLQNGARVLMTSRDERKLRALRERLAVDPDRTGIVAADLTLEADRRELSAYAMRWQGGINLLINNAGVSEFRRVESLSSEQVVALIETNLAAPLQLTRELLPHLRQQSSAHILNIGSVYGSIGYPGFAIYCATKFGVRGFTEALRRELADSSVRVHYLAPRATRTSMNSAATDAMNEQLHVAVDPPAKVARAVCRMLERDQRERVIGWPEKLFVRINALLPALVDNSLRGQLPTIRRYADTASSSAAARSSDAERNPA